MTWSDFFGLFVGWIYAARIPLVLLLGGLDAWAGRGSFMAGDTVSYMDMAHGIASGDWARAINGYWSPLYPVFLSFFVRPFLDDTVGQFAAVRFANFLIFAVSVGLFEVFLRQLLVWVHARAGADAAGWMPLPRRDFVVSCYAIFVWACFDLSMVARVSPDSAVVAMLLLGATTVLGLERGTPSKRRFLLFGVVQGLGYWLKAVLLPVGVVFLAAAAFSPGLRGRKRLLLLSAVSFAFVVAPLVLAVSFHSQRLTFGETGRLNYAWLVNGVPYELHWQGGPPGHGEPKHSTRKINSKPDVFEFASPIEATYPPWAEPSYWYEGVEPHLDIPQQFRALGRNSVRLGNLLLDTLLFPILLAVFVFAWWKMKRWQELFAAAVSMLPLWLGALSVIGLYMLVFVLDRYVAGPLLLIALLLLALVRVSRPRDAGTVVALLLVASVAGSAPRLGPVAIRAISQRGDVHDVRWKVAEEFSKLGLPPGVAVASIGSVAFNDWAYPARARVVAEILSNNSRMPTGDVEMFWKLGPEGRAHVLALMRMAGASLVVCNEVPPGADTTGWTQIPDSPYLYRFLAQSSPRATY